MEIKVIILAAGKGERLLPLTDNKPKCMIELFGKSLLEWQLGIFEKVKIKNISIVTGYKKEMIIEKNLKFYHNSNYEKTNMVETLFCAEDEFNDAVIISYGDIIFEKNVVKKLIDSKEDFSIIVDKNWKKYWQIRNENPLDDAESLGIDESGYITDIGQKINEISDVQGQYIGLMKFQGNATKIIRNFYHEMKEKAKSGKNSLNPEIPFEKSFLTDLLYGLIREGHKLKAIPIENGWLEIDTVKDYEIYNTMKINNSLIELIDIRKC